MKLKLNRAPYLFPLLESSNGDAKSHITAGIESLGYVFDVNVISEEDDRWVVMIKFEDGWAKFEWMKECFDIVED